MDVWHGFNHEVPDRVFGQGCTREFSYYLENHSRVNTANIDDVCQWLSTTEYISDFHHFGRMEYWQHPTEFEWRMKGDCDDSALWVWRKLIELGYKVEFVVGMRRQGKHTGAHAWVVFENGGRRYLFETVKRDTREMINPLDAVKDDYIPFAAVDERCRKRAYMGLLHWYRRIKAKTA